MKQWLMVIVALLMVGCSSSLPTKHYYQLASDFSGSAVTIANANKHLVVIDSIKLAGYLDKPGIVYQTNDVEYLTASNNLWASSLAQQLKNRTIHDLSVLLPGYLVVGDSLALPKGNRPKTLIALSIDSFHGSYTGDGVIKGRWIITNPKGEVSVKNFDYVLRQSEDGYDALVRTLSKGWQEEIIYVARVIK